MLLDFNPLERIPTDIWSAYGTQLIKATPTPLGVFRLIHIRTTKPKSFEEQRVIVTVVDENNFPLPNVQIAFSYSTADQYTIGPEYLWLPPSPARAFLINTGFNGTIDQIQGSAVQAGQAGGITVYVLEPEYSSDVVTGAGMLGNHAGLHLTYKLYRTGVKPTIDLVHNLEAIMANMESRLYALEAKAKESKSLGG